MTVTETPVLRPYWDRGSLIYWSLDDIRIDGRLRVRVPVQQRLGKVENMTKTMALGIDELALTPLAHICMRMLAFLCYPPSSRERNGICSCMYYSVALASRCSRCSQLGTLLVATGSARTMATNDEPLKG